MKRLLLLSSIALTLAWSAGAQAVHDPMPVESAAGFDWVVSNTPAHHCGCFSLTGLHLGLAATVHTHWAAVAEAGDVWQSNVRGTGLGLNMGRYLVGGRYR